MNRLSGLMSQKGKTLLTKNKTLTESQTLAVENLQPLHRRRRTPQLRRPASVRHTFTAREEVLREVGGDGRVWGLMVLAVMEGWQWMEEVGGAMEQPDGMLDSGVNEG
ncbi:hypothetical protein V6N11_049788 [Hibiscus sabdariffa]|uniref:Uncharacterized protein n=1 Tax=Hibiscus sabdariffa TaxID=183260 RepID=A0ABR2T7Z2_9ROSI